MEDFHIRKEKCRIYLLLSSNESNCAFLTTKLERAEMHLRVIQMIPNQRI
jgi:hypothetical protein